MVKQLKKGCDQVEPIIEEMKEIPDKASQVAEKAPDEFAELETMEKMKATKEVMGKISKIKNASQKMLKEMNSLKEDLTVLGQETESMKQLIESGKLIEDGEKCKTAKKQNLKDCFELCYGPIKNTGGGQGGCCIVFWKSLFS